MRQRFAVIAIVASILTIPTAAPAGEVRCEPEEVYRGESFVVDLPAHHEGYDLAVLGRGIGELLLISFKPGPLDKIGPVLPSAQFSRMKEIRFSTTDAIGSRAKSWRRDRPRALRRPEKIFTESGPYEVLVGPALGAYDTDFDACWIDYVDAARPTSNPRVFSPLSSANPSPTREPGAKPIARAPVQGGNLDCEPEEVYGGESVIVRLPPDHFGYDMAILDPHANQFLITFSPTRLDAIEPVVPNDVFSKLTQIEVSTKDARGSLSRLWRQDRPRVLAAPQKIFTRSGRYRVLIGPTLGVYQAGFYACWVNYSNHARPKSNSNASAYAGRSAALTP